MQPDAERKLIEEAQRKPEAFGVIFDTYYQKILAYTVRRTGDVAAAEEIVSETFAKALKGIDRFRWRGVSIEAWLFKIAVNELRMHFRTHRHVTSLDTLFVEEGFEPQSDYDLAGEAMEAQEKLERHEQFVQALQLINTLSPKYQDVLMLRFSEQKKISEIAHIVGKKEGTVKSLLSRGLTYLRNELNKQQLQPTKPSRIIKDKGS